MSGVIIRFQVILMQKNYYDLPENLKTIKT